MTSKTKSNRFANIGYDDFRAMSKDKSLSVHEKIGFPDSYRAGKSEHIMNDIAAKVGALNKREKTIVDIGCGCGELTTKMIAHCAKQQHKLLLIDSAEVLSQIPNAQHVVKISGRFPQESADKLLAYGNCDAIIAYSVMHYVYADGCIFSFMDAALAALCAGGQLLLGDIPNVSKRKRFFSSPAGVAYHREFTKKNEPPTVTYNITEHGLMDDAVIFGLMLRARNAGVDSYILPQCDNLPMANRREDLLFVLP